MMTMSRALSAGQAKDYYQKEYTSAKENYYSESGDVQGRWSCRITEEWGLNGEVRSEQYERLVSGQDPHTGEQLIRAVQEEITKRAQEAVTFARDNAVEREAVADLRTVRVDALRRNLGLTTYEAVRTELAARQERYCQVHRASKTYDVAVGDYARVKATEHGQNEITVQFEDGRDLTYNPQRLSGVSVYREAKRSFSEGDRIQFRAPFAQQGVANGELGSIEKIEDDKFTVVLESGKEVDFSVDECRHIDHGYAVTSYSSQGHTVDRVFVNADTRESEVLLNQRMGYVAAFSGPRGCNHFY